MTLLDALRRLNAYGYDVHVQVSGGRLAVQLVPTDPQNRPLKRRIAERDPALLYRTYPADVLQAVQDLDRSIDHIRTAPVVSEYTGQGYFVRLVDHGGTPALLLEDRRTQNYDGATISLRT